MYRLFVEICAASRSADGSSELGVAAVFVEGTIERSASTNLQTLRIWILVGLGTWSLGSENGLSDSKNLGISASRA